MNTPWGKSDSQIKIQRGATWVNTPGHGGLMLSKGFAEKHLSKAALAKGERYGSYYAYEEDCAYAVALWEILGFEFTFAPKQSHTVEGLGEFTREQLLKVLSTYDADYLLARGVEPDAEGLAIYNAHKLNDRMRADKSPDLIVAAWGDWAEWVPAGRTGVQTADGKRYTVPASEYAPKNLNLLSQCTDVQAVSSDEFLAIFGKSVQS